MAATTTTTAKTATVNVSKMRQDALRYFKKAVADAKKVDDLAARLAADKVETYTRRAVAVRALFDAWGGRETRGVAPALEKETGIKRPTLLAWWDDSKVIEEAGVTDFANHDKWNAKNWEAARTAMEEKYALAAEAKKGYRLKKAAEKAKAEAKAKNGQTSDRPKVNTPKGAVEATVHSFDGIVEAVKALQAEAEALAEAGTLPTAEEQGVITDILGDLSTFIGGLDTAEVEETTDEETTETAAA